MNVILCGLPFSGKSTIGKLLSEMLEWDYIETDKLVENAFALETGKAYSCREIYAHIGEFSFRALERRQIALLDLDNSVISVGGGSITDKENGERLSALGQVYYLKASPELIWKRMNGSGIPAYLELNDPEHSFYTLAKKRIPLYEALACEIIETDNRSIEEIARVLKDKINHHEINDGKQFIRQYF